MTGVGLASVHILRRKISILTGPEEGECAVKVVLAKVAEDGLILAADLVVGAEDNEQEAGVGVGKLLAVPMKGVVSSQWPRMEAQIVVAADKPLVSARWTPEEKYESVKQPASPTMRALEKPYELALYLRSQLLIHDDPD